MSICATWPAVTPRHKKLFKFFHLAIEITESQAEVEVQEVNINGSLSLAPRSSTGLRVDT